MTNISKFGAQKGDRIRMGTNVGKSKWWLLWVGFGFIALFASVYFYRGHEPLKQFGVSYEIDSGEHQEYQWVWFYWNREGHRLVGPCIHAEDLTVTYRYRRDVAVPDIVVRSFRKTDFAVLHLNFADHGKPEFELLENHNLGVKYPPPWESFYKAGKDGSLTSN